MKPDRWRQIDELFHAVAERAPHEREAFLDEACAGNDSLRHEVESLLAADSAAEEMATAKLPAHFAAELLDKPSARVAAGQLLNQYRVLSALGAGGMGEVFLAEDSRLRRKVALKLLPAQFTGDADRVRRFEQEALAVSALNHPNILTIYEVGESDRHHFLVTEFIEGQTLRQQMNDGRLPVRAVLSVATQIVSALAAAHATGIIHRDIKPENIMVRPDGVVKVLDFGLAKLSEPRIPTADPLEKKASTESGVVMGTIGYMSPEQVRGQKVDHRSDIFAVGVILFEMLSGQRAFTGDSAVEVMNAILKEEPPELSETNAKISPALDRIVRRCLEKKPEQRFQSASDLGFALSTLTTPSGARLETDAALPTVTGSLINGKARLVSNVRLAWVVAALLLLATLGLAWAHFTWKPPTNLIPGRFTIAAPENVYELMAMELSPDGRNLAFIGFGEGKRQLWVRPLDSFTARPLPGTVGVLGGPFWSPDGRWVAFKEDNKLKKIDLIDGTQQTICEVSRTVEAFSGAWNREGDILIIYFSIIYRVPATGGTPAPVPGFDAVGQGITRRSPRFLPDGQHFLYLVTTPQQESPEVYLASLDGEVNKPLLKANSNAVYTTTAEGDGRLLFVRNGTLMAQSFDAGRLTLTGEPSRVAESVLDFSVSENGTLVYIPRDVRESNQLSWIDRAGKPIESVNAAGADEALRLSFDEFPKLSPDGKRVAIDLFDPNGNGDVYVLDLARGARTRVTFDPGNDRYPVWSPDGNYLVWLSLRGGERALYRKLASGGGQEELLLKSDVNIMPIDWSANGKFILYMRYPPETQGDIWALPLEGNREPVLFLQTPFQETRARFSPDGRWIAYMSNESGIYQVYVQPFPATGAKWQVSNQGGGNPQWRGDGKELYYYSDGKQMAVEVKSGKTFEPGLPHALFDTREARQVSNTNYDVTDDGQRFLFVTRPQQASADLHFVVVTNWASAEVKK